MKAIWNRLVAAGASVELVVILVLLVALAAVLKGCPAPRTVEVIAPATPHSATVTQITNPNAADMKLLALQAQNAQLLDEVKTLHASITSITRAMGELKVSNSGPFVLVPGPAGPVGPQGPQSPPLASSAAPIAYRYQDWRLTFEGDVRTQTGAYTLSQRFEINHITGRAKNGRPVSLLTMFEIGPGDKKTEIPTTTTTTVIDDTRSRWRFAPTVQAGVGMGWAVTWPLSSPTSEALLSLQLLKHGRTAAAEDSTVAVLSPVVALGPGRPAIGLVPISVNLGRLPHQPFRDLWASPYVAWDLKARAVRAGIGLMASF